MPTGGRPAIWRRSYRIPCSMSARTIFPLSSSRTRSMLEIDILWFTNRLQIVKALFRCGSNSMEYSGKAKLFSLSWKSSRKKGVDCAICWAPKSGIHEHLQAEFQQGLSEANNLGRSQQLIDSKRLRFVQHWVGLRVSRRISPILAGRFLLCAGHPPLSRLRARG